MFDKILKNNSGTTLLELMVAVAIFAVVMLAAMGIFRAVVDGQRSAVAAQNTQESVRYALEMTAKEIRTAQPSDGSCKSVFNPEPTPLFQIFNTADNGGALYFKNKNEDCVGYYLESGRLKITRGADAGFITPAAVKISGLKFSVNDEDMGVSPRGSQAAVTMETDIEAIGKEAHKQTMKIQTTVSSRYYE
ncbi:prepilin-type N-terminal cleavage/methylation domain-containing protein [Candidatus Falkowbacteria bacterium]|nr:prepilin-type N-terminal cleavage/methylation domain-containing protein [Candidatus Falkowbacteria bacterium]